MAGPAVSTLARYSERDVAIQEQQEASKQSRIDILGEDAKLLSFAAGVERENYSATGAKNWMYEQGWSLFGSINPVAAPTEYLPDPNYEFDKDEANFGYDPMLMIEAQSEAEAFAMRTQIDRENSQMQIIQDSASGTWGMVFGGVMQPHVALSLAITPVSLPLAIGTEIALEGASEAALHSQQLTRTTEESAMNVIFAGVGVGVIGGASKWLANPVKSPTRSAKLIDEINTGAYDAGGAAGAQRVGHEITMEEDTLAKAGGSQLLADKLSIGQVAATLVKSPSKVARTLVQKIANNPLFTKAHEAGKTHGITVEAFNKAAMGKTVLAVKKAAPIQKASGLQKVEFEEEVGKAMSSGDRHANPKVQEAAEMYRAEVVGPIREAAERVGLLEGADSLNIKIAELDTQIQEILTGGKAGPGSKVARATIEAEVGKIEAKADKTTVKLQKKVESLEAKLLKARTPKADGKKRTASKELMTEYNDARKLLTAHRKATKAETKAHRGKLAEMKVQDDALKAARKEKRELNKKLATGGTSFAESYFPRIYNRDKVLKNWNRLAGMLEDNFNLDKQLAKLSPDKMHEMVQDTLENMILGRYQNMTVKGEPSPTRARTVSLMDDVLNEFLEKNASEAMIRYTRSMQPHIMFREVFQGRTLSDLLDEIKADYRAMREAEDDPSAARINELSDAYDADVANMNVMYDRLTNQVQRSIKPQSTIVKWLQASKVLNTAAMLGEIVLTSLPDLARPISHFGMRSFGKGVSTMVKQFSGAVDNIHSTQAMRLGASLQRILNDRASQFADSLEPQGRVVQETQKLWSKWSGFDMYTDIVQSISAHAAMDYTLRAAKKVASKQPLSKAETKQIARMGLDAEDLVAIYKESMGTMGAQEKNLKYMNTMAWEDIGLAKRVEAGIGSDIDRTILNAGIGDKPAWMDDVTVSWLFQFQTFAMQSQNKIMVAGLQNMNRHTAEGLVTMLALGASVGAIKASVRGEDVSKWTVDQWVMEGIDRSGMAGAMRYPLNLLRWHLATNGVLDSAPSRFIDREGAGLLIAPGVGLIDNALKGVNAAATGDFETAGKKLSKALPFNNLWGVRNTLMTLGDM